MDPKTSKELDTNIMLPDSAAVQRCTAAYTEKQGDQAHQPVYASRIEIRDVIIAFRITRSLVERIDTYKVQYHKKSRTDAIMDLLEAALFIMENARRLDDPALVKYFQENLYNVQLVDDIMEWPQDRIEALIGVLASERERRFRLKLGRHSNG